jgi:diamine N-acetyltransferase
MNSIGIGVVVNPPYRKKGIATDSLTLLINHCFKNLGIKKIWCNIHEKNDSSLRLFQKLGFEIIHKRHDSYLMHEVLFLQLDLSSWK